jgi:Mg-chelatase subunit ChlD
LSKGGITALEGQYAEQDQKVREAQKKVDRLQADLGISDGVASGEGPTPLMTAETLRKLESLRLESKAEYDRQAQLLDRLKSLEKKGGPEALSHAVPSAVSDSLLSGYLEQLAAAEQKRIVLEKDHGPEDAEVIKSKAMADDSHKKIKDRAEGIMLGLDARVTSLKRSLDDFEKEVEQARRTDVAEAEQTQAYFAAKHTLDELQRSRKSLEVTPAGEKTDGIAPKPAAPAPIPQPEVQTAENAFSTFSLNVSDVSLKLAAASLEKGVMPEPAAVRSEEFINAFDYRDPEPPPGVPVAFAWERAQYPFAQNRDLLRFSIKTAALGRQPGRALNIVLLLDNSGSMERADRVRIIREALRVLAGQLQPQDIFSVVTFARTAHLWVDGVPGNQAAQVAEEVSGLTPEGGTNLEDAMELAYQTALRHYLASGVNRVVLLTDGAANLGNVEPEALKQKVEAHRKQGVALDCFGIGWEGYNDDLLEVLARNGDGRYAFLNSPEEVASEFAAKLAGALQVAASDVKVQVEFNPDRVTAYRQIGYAKHQLTKEQFRDNTVNAAQIGAAEAGNALYTVEVNPAGAGPLCTVRVRFRIPGTQDYREHAWDVPFTGNAVALEQASPAMRLAATASALSEWLASSPYAGEVSPDRLLGYLSGVPEVYGADARPKKLEWMIRQAKSISGK